MKYRQGHSSMFAPATLAFALALGLSLLAVGVSEGYAGEKDLKAQIEAATKNLATKDDTKAQIEAATKGLATKEDTKAQIEAATKGLATKEDTKAQIQAATKGLATKDEIVAAVVAAMKKNTDDAPPAPPAAPVRLRKLEDEFPARISGLNIWYYKSTLALIAAEAAKREEHHKARLADLQNLYDQVQVLPGDHGTRRAFEIFIEQQFQTRKQYQEADVLNLLRGTPYPYYYTPMVPVFTPAAPSAPCSPILQRLRRSDAGVEQGNPRALGGAFGAAHGRGFKVPPDFAAVKQKLNATRRQATLAAHKFQLTNLPANFDTRDSLVGAVPPIRDQQQCGACWIFGTVGAYEFNYLYSNQGQIVDASEQYILNCVQTVAAPCQGASPQDAARFLKSPGTASRSEVPYVAALQTCGGAIRFMATDFAYLEGDQVIPPIDEMKAAIKQYGALVVGIHAGEQGSLFQNYTGGLFSSGDGASDGSDVDHAVALVGWKTINNDTYWILRNSWGTGWGDSGYMTIKAGVNSVGFGALWVSAAASTNPPPVGPTNGSVVTDRIRYWQQNNPQVVPN